MVALGALVGAAASQLIPVADTLAEALGEAGLGPQTAQAIIFGLFATSGAEAALLLHSIMRKKTSRRESA